MPPSYLLDTNVLINAARLEQSVTFQCQRNCIQQINRWHKLNSDGQRDRLLLLDDSGLILKEYIGQFERARRQRKKGKQGAPDPGLVDVLAQEMVQLRSLTGDTALEHGVRHIHLATTTADEFEEFPHDDDQLSRFDRSDRKWVAAACACQQQHQETPEIVNATDSDWNDVAEHLLTAYGIPVITICG